MPKTYGVEYPERELMSVLSDLLAIPHFTTANGSTVRKDFLLAVAGALDVPYAETLNKDPLLAACVEAATHAPMPAELYSTGGTVTDKALTAIIDGVIQHGVPGAAPPQPAAPEPEAEELPPVFDPATVTDIRDKRLVEQAIRQGQDKFRQAVLEAYSNKCAITGCEAVEGLQAAHITPYLGAPTNLTSNGILLRADIHALFDRGSLAIDEETFAVLLKPHLLVTQYADLAGVKIDLPTKIANRPSIAALKDHREWCGL